MLRIIVLDDDKRQVNNMVSILEKSFNNIIVDTALSVAEIDKKRELKEYDLYFLDIELGEDSGLEYGIKIRNTNKIADIVFVTSHDQHALEAYNARPLDYLVKPVEEEKLINIVKEVQRKINSKKYVVITENYHKIAVSMEEILYLESCSKKTKIVTLEDEYIINEPLKSIHKRLDKSFIPISRSQIINSLYITSILKDSKWKRIELYKGIILDFSKQGYREFFRLLAESRPSK